MQGASCDNFRSRKWKQLESSILVCACWSSSEIFKASSNESLLPVREAPVPFVLHYESNLHSTLHLRSLLLSFSQLLSISFDKNFSVSSIAFKTYALSPRSSIRIMLKTTQTEHQSRAKAIRDEKRCINSKNRPKTQTCVVNKYRSFSLRYLPAHPR